MGLNMIRLWGGAGVTRKPFYDACDEAGILVWQEFCITGDCNGRGATPVRRASALWQTCGEREEGSMHLSITRMGCSTASWCCCKDLVA